MTENTPQIELVGVSELSSLTGWESQRLLRMIRGGELPYVQKLPGRTGAYLISKTVAVELAQRIAEEAESRARRIREEIAS